MGRKPVRIAIRDPDDATVPIADETLEQARERLLAIGCVWPALQPRLAIEGGTGLGKTTLARRLAAQHAVVEGEDALLYVLPTVRDVETAVTEIRTRVIEAGRNASVVADLLGRQGLDPESGDAWSTRRFGCMDRVKVGLAGDRGRSVAKDVCEPCSWAADCARQGYQAHLHQADSARVICTTKARLISISDELWARIGCVICDEDVVPGLMAEHPVLGADLKRASRWIQRRVERDRARGRLGRRTVALQRVLSLLGGVLDVMREWRGRESEPLVQHLPEELDRYATDDGLREITGAYPLRWLPGPGGRRRPTPLAGAPAEWERATKRRMPRQVWGRFLEAMGDDLRHGGAGRAGTIWIETRPGRRARLRIVRFDARTIAKLRERPLLLVDATLHPCASAMLDAEHVVIHYRQGRSIVQALTVLHSPDQIVTREAGKRRLTDRGKRVVRQCAAWAGGRKGYVLCRKSLKPLLEKEASGFYELRRIGFVTYGWERGWDADPDADVFIVLGRYAKNVDACRQEAHALRALFQRVTRSTEQLDRLEREHEPHVFRGRGKAVTYMGELVERKIREPDDRLAALLQDADRIAGVTHFIGRNRNGRAWVLLLRGDPTVPVDALVEGQDLAEALPARDGLRRRPDGRREHHDEPVEEVCDAEPP